MKPLLAALFFLTAHPSPPAGPLATCKGEDPCKACRTCRLCKYCNSGQGSCSVKREEEDRKYAARHPAGGSDRSSVNE